MYVSSLSGRRVIRCALLLTGFSLFAIAGCGGGGGEDAKRAEAPADKSAPKAQTAAALPAGEMPMAPASDLIDPQESTLTMLTRLTFAGDSGEAYWSPNADRILYQSTYTDLHPYDQIYMMSRDGTGKHMVSTGEGRTTCSYFVPGTNTFVYASTHLREGVPPKPEGHGGYEWGFDEAYDIFLADFSGKVLRRLTDTPGYDAEGTISPSGRRMIWTSMRDGDLDVYAMNLDGTDVKRITTTEGYDGGAFYSPDESMIVYRGSRTGNYKDLQIYVCDADGTNHRQLTHNDAVNFAPYFYPDGEHIIFCSNMDAVGPADFDLYMMKTDGSERTRITFAPGFDGFPHVANDGRSLLFCSNRADPTGGGTHVYHADFTPYWK